MRPTLLNRALFSSSETVPYHSVATAPLLRPCLTFDLLPHAHTVQSDDPDSLLAYPTRRFAKRLTLLQIQRSADWGIAYPTRPTDGWLTFLHLQQRSSELTTYPSRRLANDLTSIKNSASQNGTG